MTPDFQGEKGEQKSGGKPPEREIHLSLFSLAAAMKPWKTASGLRTVPTACAHSLFPLWLSPYTEKSVHFLSRKRTVATTNRGQRVNMAKKSKRHTGGFILKKSPET